MGFWVNCGSSKGVATVIGIVATVGTVTTGVAQVGGVCGPMNGALVSAPPTTNLCASGTSSAVKSVPNVSGVWTWTCGVKQSCATGTATRSWWQPGPITLEWQWEIDHPLNISSASDMGTGQTAFNGTLAPTTDPVVYDIDGFDNPASTVAALHAKGKIAVCYIEVGAAENYRADYNLFPTATLGRSMPGYSSERYIDIRDPTVVSIIKARILMCAQKGFDAIEPDIDESYGAATGFPLTLADEEAYMITLASYAHGLGVAMLGKNPDDTGDSYAADMVSVFDAILTEQCNQYSSCTLLDAYTGVMPVFNAEYSSGSSGGSTTGTGGHRHSRHTSGSAGIPAFCEADNARMGWNGVLFPVALDGRRTPCQ